MKQKRKKYKEWPFWRLLKWTMYIVLVGVLLSINVLCRPRPVFATEENSSFDSGVCVSIDIENILGGGAKYGASYVVITLDNGNKYHQNNSANAPKGWSVSTLREECLGKEVSLWYTPPKKFDADYIVALSGPERTYFTMEETNAISRTTYIGLGISYAVISMLFIALALLLDMPKIKRYFYDKRKKRAREKRKREREERL